MSANPISLLIVDDEEQIRKLLAVNLGTHYNCTTAASTAEAITLLTTTSFNLVLSDITMPGASGLELCNFVSEKFPDTVVIMISAMTDIEYAIDAMRQGAFDYIVKPFDLLSVMLAVDRALKHQALLSLKRHYEESLETTVRLRTIELSLLNQNLNEMLQALYSNYRATLRSLAKALEARDVESRGHSDRVVAYCLRLGKELGLTQRDLIGLEQGALLHDIGKIGVRDSILLKPGPLTQEEWVEMREHVNHGLRIIDGIDFLSSAQAVVGQHHEKYDGSGYPQGLCGEVIHIHARIFAVADAYDAITSDRPYRAAASYAQARDEIIAHSGMHFDPKVVDAFLCISETELAEIRRLAEMQDYTRQIIEEQEIRSFIVSLKYMSGLSGQSRMPSVSAAGF
jgi:response regulator RpfG family c-di-GMP phosphodiesterase